ncbi:ATP-binding cassette domain-containing protein [Sedimentibacter hydroxybenzoicus DSM 7310]|uniref:ATP-binding cassette domain-containing protein n=1 Tax=Sedimentibacter hydroxybenzoicus DSM 7310 TaxID=1123245 RepID=A0A974GVR6_SEDHY|nr:ATP-binding cassette domain-containing protein [Sedimentibacter hydroxybenzoicus]NYB73687.1 ATP-binding cassette domain-containing protein [Sedimentibacter hydroxybenzoicus DSM 7310]
MILLENVSKTFQADGKVVEAVKNVNLSLREGKIHGIIGFSGAGKSTLVRCINLLERPTEGKVILGDVEITALDEKELREERKKIGMIFQQFNLFASRTVFQNIAYPLKNSGLSRNEVENKVNYLLELVELKEKSGAYPSQLSGGQKQRVAIARALANDPKILLSDEATSALDPQTTKSILKLLKQLNEKLGITVIVITHEMQVVKEICDNVVVMENGRVVEQGDVFSIFANPVEKITKDFVDSTSNLTKVHELINENAEIVRLKEGECILKFTYLKRDASEALVSHISRSFELDVNIIFGNIELIGSYPIGGLISVVSGRESSINDAINYLREKNVGVEVILDARVSK